MHASYRGSLRSTYEVVYYCSAQLHQHNDSSSAQQKFSDNKHEETAVILEKLAAAKNEVIELVV